MYKYEHVFSALKGKNIKPECPMCNDRKWIINEQLQSLMPLSNDKTMVVSPDSITIPLIQVICENCGFIANYSEEILMKK